MPGEPRPLRRTRSPVAIRRSRGWHIPFTATSHHHSRLLGDIQLAASNEPATLDILKNTVVLVLTGENPDGHERFATWYNSVAVGDPNHNAIEHREPWVWGRVNHYRFNLNRDTLTFTQKESRDMQKAFMEWNPQVAVDHHGQPSQYFFPPVSLPINPNLPQPQYSKWLDTYVQPMPPYRRESLGLLCAGCFRRILSGLLVYVPIASRCDRNDVRYRWWRL
ncbi:MAG: hypothetical protein IPP63_08680 [Chloracidobacterium sp.]|nr:hypothetical protein [Chloracidobacterium sp.]